MHCGWRPIALGSSSQAGSAADIPQADQLGLLAESNSKPGRLKTHLWAYAIAPIVAPVVFAIVVFVFGMVYLAAHPDDPGTPIGVLLVPILSLTAGVLISYVLAGVIGMPIIFLLERRGKLNGYTIHGAALASSFVLFAMYGGLIYASSPSPRPPVGELVALTAALFAFTSPCVLASATAYWWIVSRGIQGLSLRTLLLSVTALAVLLGLATPLLRRFF